MDIDHIEPGEDFVEVIEESVGACNVLISLIGRYWTSATDENGERRLESTDDFVRLELEAALARKVRLIPVLVGGARMPRTVDLPTSLQHLARRQAIEISDTRFHVDVDRLVEVIERRLRNKAPEDRGLAGETNDDKSGSAQSSSKPKQPDPLIPTLKESRSPIPEFVPKGTCVADIGSVVVESPDTVPHQSPLAPLQAGVESAAKLSDVHPQSGAAHSDPNLLSRSSTRLAETPTLTEELISNDKPPTGAAPSADNASVVAFSARTETAAPVDETSFSGAKDVQLRVTTGQFAFAASAFLLVICSALWFSESPKEAPVPSAASAFPVTWPYEVSTMVNNASYMPDTAVYFDNVLVGHVSELNKTPDAAAKLVLRLLRKFPSDSSVSVCESYVCLMPGIGATMLQKGDQISLGKHTCSSISPAGYIKCPSSKKPN